MKQSEAQKIIGCGRECLAKSINGPELENIASFVNKLFWLHEYRCAPYPTTPPQKKKKSSHVHQKMRKRCKNNNIEAFGAVYLAKKKTS